MKIHDVEQGTGEWHTLRAGKPTASEFSKIITSQGEPSKSAATYAITLAVEAYAGGPVDAWEGNAHSERGKALETEAIALYEFTRDVTVDRVGFVTDDAEEVGCSPDGFVGHDGLIEVKCLKAENHVKSMLYFQKNGRCLPDYVQQSQGQMMLCERQWCDLLFFHPVLPMLIIRQTPDEILQKALVERLVIVRKERDRVFKALLKEKEG